METNIDQKLRKAYIELVKKDEEKISVSALCKKGNVSRASFYIHYNNIDEFITKTRNYIVTKLFEQMISIIETSEASKPNKLIFNETDLELFRIYIGTHNYQDFAFTANEILYPKYKELMVERWGEKYFEENERLFEFAINGAVGMLCLDLLYFDKETFMKNGKRMTRLIKDLFLLNS